MHEKSLLRQIRASAGSGKTHALTTAFLDLLAETQEDDLSTECPAACRAASRKPEEILAVTFTNRAAAEMRERVVNRLKLSALGRGAQDGKAVWTRRTASRRLDAVLRRYESLNIRTIDSLLHLVVRLGALQLDLPPNFTSVFDVKEALAPLLDDLLETLCRNETASTLLADVCRDLVLYDPGCRGFGGGKRLRERISDLVVPLLQAGSRLPASPADVAAYRETLALALRSRADVLLNCLNETGLKSTTYFLKALEACRIFTAENPLPSSTYLRKDTLEECLLKVSQDRICERSRLLFAELRSAVKNLDEQDAALRQALHNLPLVPLAQTLVHALPDHLRRGGAVPAVLIPPLARQTLLGDYGVSEMICRLGTSITHVLIDEFQDTAREQWEAVRPLILEALSHGGSLTWVGDVKQAVYGWRGGDAMLFDELLCDKELTSIAPVPRLETLPTNWRSCSTVVQFNNMVFSRLSEPTAASAVLTALLPSKIPQAVSARASKLTQRAFAQCGQTECGKKGGYVRLIKITDTEFSDQPNPDDRKEHSDAKIRVHLLHLMNELSRRRSWSELTVLVRSNEQAAQVAGWLTTQGIPVITDNSFLLSEHPLINRLAALLTFADTPTDDAAFWALICGPLFPFSEQEQADFIQWPANRPRGVPLFAAFREAFPETWETWMAPFFTGGTLLSAYDTVCEALHLARIFERFPQENAFIRRFLEVLHTAGTQGRSSIAAFLDYWREHDREEKVPLPESVDAVRVMTMHKAKGLQFPVVIIPWHDIDVRSNRLSLPTVLTELNGLHILSHPLPSEDGNSPLADAAREALHLLYVAWTRPEEELYGFLPSGSAGVALEALLDGLPFHNGVYERGRPATSLHSNESADASSRTPEEPSDQDIPPTQSPPRLRIFRNALEPFAFTPRRRGVFMHHCLGRLLLSGDPKLDAQRAIQEGLRTFPVPLSPDAEQLDAMTTALAWYAALPEAKTHLSCGTTERVLVDESGEIRRADLVVEEPDLTLVAEYKTGHPDEESKKTYEMQLLGYMRLLRQIRSVPVQGMVVYLDERTVTRHVLD